jgi:Fe-S-cluster-containing hydrogenase component 2
MDKVFHITPERCIGCRTCELACAFSQSERIGQTVSKIRAITIKPEKFVPIVCLQCDDAACVRVCPVRALWRNMETGAVEVVAERCIRCKSCVAACPFGNMLYDQNKKIILKCNLCSGSPKCAMFCPTKTLEYY